MSSPAPSKHAIRNEMLVRRKQLQEGEWLEKSSMVALRASCMEQVVDAEHILLYLSMKGSREVSTEELAVLLAETGKKLCVPVVRNDRLVPAAYQPGEKLVRGRFGQPEPERFRADDAGSIQVVIMPLVAVDSNGVRLGYGRGYFDRFLSGLAVSGVFPCRIGLAFSLQFLPALPGDPWDEPLDYVVLENGVMPFTKRTPNNGSLAD